MHPCLYIVQQTTMAHNGIYMYNILINCHENQNVLIYKTSGEYYFETWKKSHSGVSIVLAALFILAVYIINYL